MAGNTFPLYSTRDVLEGRIVWNSTSNGSQANSSNVSASIQIRRNDGYTTSGTWSGQLYIKKILIDGEQAQEYIENFSTYAEVSYDWVTVKSIDNVLINHHSDGSCSCRIGGWCNGPSGTTMEGHYVDGAQDVALDKIARKSTVTCADGNIGSATTININRANVTFTHTLTYSFGSSSPITGTIATKTSEASVPWTIPTTFYAKIPNAKSGVVTITCETFDGNTSLGTNTTTCNAFVVNSEPTITGTVVDSNSTTTALTGDSNKIVKYYSNAQVNLTATGQNSATISSVLTKCGDGKTLTTSTGTINNVESNIFDLSCIDSRGFASTTRITKTLVDYIKIAITNCTIERPSSVSTSVNISVSGNYFNDNFGSQNNTLTLRYRYKLTTTTDYSGWGTLTPTITNNTFSYSGALSITLDADKDYDIQVEASDKLDSYPVTRQVLKGVPLEDRWKDNVKVNGHFHCDDLKVTDGTNYEFTIKGTPTDNRTVTLPDLTGTSVIKQDATITTETNGWYKVNMGAFIMYYKNGEIPSDTYQGNSWGTKYFNLPSGITFDSSKMAITANAGGEDRAISCSPVIPNGSTTVQLPFKNQFSGSVTTRIFYNAVLYDFS